MENQMLDCGFDPQDNRMMHYGDEEGEPHVLFNPGRLRMPAWAFFEVGRLRQEILRLRLGEGSGDLDRQCSLRQRLQKEVIVQNMPFLAVDEESPLQYFAPISCRMRDLVPISFYLSHDTYAMPPSMQEDVRPQAEKIMPGWRSPIASRIWMSNGAPWRLPFPPWSDDVVPEPTDESMICSCFHCDRMENLHTMVAGMKRIVLVPPGHKDVLRATSYAVQRQWLAAPVSAPGGMSQYLGFTTFTSKQAECSSCQSAVHPLRSAESNRRVSAGQWPDHVDFPVRTCTLRQGDTLYIPAYHWHWVATTPPPMCGSDVEGPLAISVNFWWWPIHNDEAMEQWSLQNEEESWRNARSALPADAPAPDRSAHSASFRRLTSRQRHEAQVPQPWPPAPAPTPSSPSRPLAARPPPAAAAAAAATGVGRSGTAPRRDAQAGPPAAAAAPAAADAGRGPGEAQPLRDARVAAAPLAAMSSAISGVRAIDGRPSCDEGASRLRGSEPVAGALQAAVCISAAALARRPQLAGVGRGDDFYEIVD